MILGGRVTLNGGVVHELGTRALWGEDRIQVDGREIPQPSERLYIVLNKPFGYICSMYDPSGRPTVMDLLGDLPQRVYPVGRLDFDSLGLLLLTNDGEWANRLSHPRYHVPRTYKVTVEGLVSEESLKRLQKGVDLEDGFSGRSKAILIGQGGGRSLIRMTVISGRTRLVRRMLEAVGHRVIHLLRIGVGTLELGNLKVGQYRHLEDHEIQELKKQVGLH